MPIMNGLEAIKILKSDPVTKDIKVIAVTSFAMAGDKEDVFFQKCFRTFCGGKINKAFIEREIK